MRKYGTSGPKGKGATRLLAYFDPQSKRAARMGPPFPCVDRIAKGGLRGDLDLLDGNRDAVRDRLGAFAGQLQNGFGGLRGLGDHRVERRADIVAVQLEEVGRRLAARQA